MLQYETIDHPRYKYRLTADYVHELAFKVPTVWHEWITLLPNRCLVMKAGYCWDGLSGAPFEVKDSQRGSAVHDAICQLISLGLLPYHPFRRYGDKEMRRVWLKDRVNRIMVDIMYSLVRLYAITKSAVYKGETLWESPAQK